MRKLLYRIRVWNYWRKRSLNTKLHKLLVLFGLRHSPTFTFATFGNYLVHNRKTRSHNTREIDICEFVEKICGVRLLDYQKEMLKKYATILKDSNIEG